jgi:hypothetical protein
MAYLAAESLFAFAGLATSSSSQIVAIRSAPKAAPIIDFELKEISER